MYKKIICICFFLLSLLFVGCSDVFINYTKSAEILQVSRNDNKYEVKIVIKEKNSNEKEIQRNIMSTEGDTIKECIEKIRFSENENVLLSSVQYIIINNITSKNVIKNICKEFAEIKTISPKSYMFFSFTDTINDKTMDFLQSKLKNIQNINFRTGNELYLISSHCVDNLHSLLIPIIKTTDNNIYCKYIGVCDKDFSVLDIEDFKFISNELLKFKPYTINIENNIIDIKDIVYTSEILKESDNTVKINIIISPIAYIRENIQKGELKKIKIEVANKFKEKAEKYTNEKYTENLLYKFIRHSRKNQEILENSENIEFNITVNTDFISS